jgi:hypothetical protein
VLSFSGTLGGAGAGDEAEEVGVSNLLLPPGELERSVGVSGLSPFRSAPPLPATATANWLSRSFLN